MAININKGIILAGGSGTRLYPLTFSVTKQLLPVHDKPMIYYPLSTLLELDITNILIITTRRDLTQFKNLLGDGQSLGINISYEIQNEPNGIAEGLIIAEEFLNNEPCAFILGDNLFIGAISQNNIKNQLNKNLGATIFSYQVNDPERYGIVSTDKLNNPTEIIEKPKNNISNKAITGLYFYDRNASKIARNLTPSERNELEITDVNKYYLDKKILDVIPIDDHVTWLDAGTIDSLYEASNFVSALEKRTGKKIACIEEILFHKKKMNLSELKKARKRYGSSIYGSYLQKIINKN